LEFAIQQVEGVPVTMAARAIRDAYASHLGAALIHHAIEDGRRTGHLMLDEGERLEQELLGMKPRRQNHRTKSKRGVQRTKLAGGNQWRGLRFGVSRPTARARGKRTAADVVVKNRE